MTKTHTIGWDIGGAHLKVVALDNDGTVIYVDQIETPLWKGLEVLDQAVESLPEDLITNTKSHGVTMTGELADIFPDRISGVRELVNKITTLLGQEVNIYAGEKGWLSSGSIEGNEVHIASANWHATAQFLATKIKTNGLLIDMGSTTTDIIPLVDGKPDSAGFSDQERLQKDELVYTGVNRTSVTAVVSSLPFAGEWQQIAAEYFSTMGDIYCLTEDIPENAGFTTADGKGTSLLDCARRLARVTGNDLHEAELAAWQELAHYISGQQMQQISASISRVKSRYPTDDMPVIGTGAGQFLIRRLAEWHNMPYYDFADFLQGDEMLKQAAAICAPAMACSALIKDIQPI